MKKLYCVSPGAQEAQIEKYCFKECGKIIFGGIEICGGTFLICRTDDCKFTEKSMELGIEKVYGKKERIIVRKLITGLS